MKVKKLQGNLQANYKKNIVTTIEKIREVLKAKGLNPTRAEREMKVSQGTLAKAFQRGGSVHESTVSKFIGTFHVKQSWWDTQKGEMFEEKLTSVSEKPEEPVTSKDDYRIVRGLLDEKDRVIDMKDVVIKLHEGTIARLNLRIEELERDLAACRANPAKK